jgi:hypothetical protein
MTASRAAQGSQTALRTRQGLIALAALLTVFTVARSLPLREFGILACGLAAFWVAAGLSDGGLSVHLARELAARPQDETRLLAIALRAAQRWALVLAALLAVAGAAAIAAGSAAGGALGTGATGTRGVVMLALAPAVALGGAGAARQVVAIRGRSAPFVLAELGITLVLFVSTAILAIRHQPVTVIAGNLSFWTCLRSVPALVGARRLLRRAPVARGETLRFLRAALPAGLACALPVVSLSLELALLGWFVRPAVAGQEAVALRILLLVVAVPGLLLTGGARALGGPVGVGEVSEAGRVGEAGESRRIAAGTASLLHTLLLVAVPLAAAVALLAHPLIREALGHAYLGAVRPLRELMAAAVLTVAAVIAGVLAVGLGLERRLIICGSAGAAVGAAMIAVLARRHGIDAAAWAAIASQGVIVAGAVVSLARSAMPLEAMRVLLSGPRTAAPRPPREASAHVAATAAAGNVAAGLIDPSGGVAAAATALGGRVAVRPLVGEARRPKAEPLGAQRGALALAATLAIALAAVLGARVEASPAPASPETQIAGPAPAVTPPGSEAFAADVSLRLQSLEPTRSAVTTADSGGQLAGRAAPESSAASADRAAAAGLLTLAVPAGDRSALLTAADALKAEGASLATLATAAAAGNVVRYRAASLSVERASNDVAAAVAALQNRGLAVPRLTVLTVPPLAEAADRSGAGASAHKRSHRGQAGAHAGSRRRSRVTTRGRSTKPSRAGSAAGSGHGHSAPAVRRTAPVVRSTAPVVRSTAPVVRSTAPVVRSTAPVVRSTAPVVRSTAPVVRSPAPSTGTAASSPSQGTSSAPSSGAGSTGAGSSSSSATPTPSTSSQPAPTTVVVPVSGHHTSSQSTSHGGVVVVPAG